MPEQGELPMARTSFASSAGERRPGRDGRRGTSEMLAALYADHGGDLRRFAAGPTGDHGRGEDIVQETMLRAWRHSGTAGGRHGDSRAWLYTVARRVAIDQHRARQARPAEVAGRAALAGRAAPDHIDAAITRWDPVGAVDGLLPSLPRPAGRVLSARPQYRRDRRRLARPAGTVKSRLATARDVLRRRLQTGNGIVARQETITVGWAR
jgi:RNA polymerase sigma-70 factor, ECF subfamily